MKVRKELEALTIERIKEIFKKEFRCNLYKTYANAYRSKSDLVYMFPDKSGFYVSLHSDKKGRLVSITERHITTEKELLDLIRKFKKVR